MVENTLLIMLPDIPCVSYVITLIGGPLFMENGLTLILVDLLWVKSVPSTVAAIVFMD